MSTDFFKAFDQAIHERALSKLHLAGIRPYITNFLDQFYSQASGIINGHAVNCMKGVPQGSVTSPIIWSKYCNDLMQQLDDCGHKPLVYTDDFVWSAVGTMQLIQSIKIVKNWYSSNIISINKKKSKFMHIRPDRRTPQINLN
mgnify:FL=1